MVTRNEFEGGLYTGDWKDALASIIEEYALAGTNKTDLYRIVEVARRRKADDSGVVLSVQDKSDITEMLKNQKLDPQLVLFNKFINHEYAKEFVFIKEQNNLIIYKKTGKQMGGVIEVEALATHRQAKTALMLALEKIQPAKASSAAVNSLYEYLMIKGDIYSVDQVYYILQAEEATKYTYKVIPRVEIVDTRNELRNSWNLFLDRLSDPEAFGAWVWSVYDHRHTGRQMLYLQGDGFTGKSVVMNTIIDAFGREYMASLIPNDFSQENRFGLSKCLGKRLVCMPETNNQNILKYEKLKQVLGDDSCQIERKHQDAFSVYLNCRLWVNSNHPVSLANQVHELSRILWITVGTWQEKYEPRAEWNGNTYPDKLTWSALLKRDYDLFLQWCKFCYKERVYKHGNIKSDIAETFSSEHIAIKEKDSLEELLDVYDLNADSYISRKEFTSFIDDLHLSREERRDFCSYLETLKIRGITRDVRNTGSRDRIVVGLKRKHQVRKPFDAKVELSKFDMLDEEE